MARGGKRKGAGRKRGSKTKLTREIESRLGAEKPPQWAASAVKSTLAEIMASYDTTMAEVLVSIACDGGASATARVQAACAVLDRGHGKPTQAHELSGKDGGPVQVLIVGSDAALL